ncbi:hypothetical protein AVEN_100539-1 [Araneus ventricosus]|uniref:Uncharacterized protein n=1 Tax=Araneus ventricosus TaxID=182803 RepID=A0A4Y2ITA7_ARAVE|nr:hypothetical protein AVEN_100539-1 [Araneus ventricosus]
MTAPQITSIPSSAAFGRWQHYSNADLPFKVYDRFLSTKSTAHFITQSLQVLAICAYTRSTWKCNYRFLDIQTISKKLGIAPVVCRAVLSYKSQYLPQDHGNSFCVVVKIRDYGPKGLRL